jgi:hypothetical protein
LKIRLTLLSAAAVVVLLSAAALSPIALAQENAQPTSQVAQFQKIEDQWSTSVAKQDQFTLETILSPSFVGITSTGERTTRDQVVAMLFETGVPRVQEIQQKVDDVRVIEDVAIVDGTYAVRTKLNGVQREEQGVYTHIYQHTHGTWLCVQSQQTAFPPQANEGKKSRKKKSLF